MTSTERSRAPEDRGLTVVVPAHDEAGRICPTLERLGAHASPSFEIREIVVVDDGSSDGTGDLVAAGFPDVRLVRHPARRGKGAAVRSGVGASTQPWVLIVDADLSVPLEHLEDFAAAAADAPVVIGSKYMSASEFRSPPLRRLAGRAGNLLVRLLAAPGIHDTQCGFKLLRGDVARFLFRHQVIDGFGYDFEVLFLARRFGQPVVEVPIRGVHGRDGSVSVKSYLGVLRDLAVLVANRMRGRYPRPEGAALPSGEA